MMLRNNVCSVLLLSLLSATSVMAQSDATGDGPGMLGDSLAQFESFTTDLVGFSAEFTQSAFDEQGYKEESSSGVLQLLEPNLLRWEYTEPFPQLIIADGEQVWSYDIGLEQITVRPQDAAQSQSPLTLLTDPEALYKAFTLRDMGREEQFALLELVPVSKEGEQGVNTASDFARIVIAMQNNLIASMSIEDALGQMTRIEFSEAERNPELEADSFRFDPPEGVDVLEG